MLLEEVSIRTIQPSDNKELARVIRTTLMEFGANHPGTVYDDPTTDDLYSLFTKTSGSIYYVATLEGRILGGGGIFPSSGLPVGTCELVKMYLLPEARSIGLGKKLIGQCLTFARQSGYRHIYIETMPELQQALKTYEKFGFTYLDKPMGNTGHFGCALFMLLDL